MPTLRPASRIPSFAPKCVEHERMIEDAKGVALWKKWGTYLSERCWGTVREDYSSDGDAWNFLPHDHARSKAYRWAKTDWAAGATANNCYVSRLRSGMAQIPS